MTLFTAAVIPARNEAEILGETLAALRTIAGLSRILVVDDGSQDATARIARSHRAEVLSASPPGKSRGKGFALRVGLAHARNRGVEAVLLADADLGPSASRLGELLDALYRHPPIVVASFPPAGAPAGFGLVKSLSRRAILQRTGYAPFQPLSGQRALLISVLDTLRRGIAPGFGAEVGMTLDLISAGIKPAEIPLPLTHRSTGRNLSGFAHRAQQGLDIARALRGARIPW